MDIIRKTHTDRNSDGKSFVLSDETPDRMGDIIMADGWDLTSFKSNPVALWAHLSSLPPIGTWENLRVEKRALIGDFKPAPRGTSDRIDEITRLIEAGIVKATSVGFKPIERKPRKIDNEFVGEIFTKQELVEVSAVAVPANPRALAIAKELKISEDTHKLVFAEIGNADKPKLGDGHIGEFAKLYEPDRWSPEQAAQAKRWLASLQKSHPGNWIYRKLYQLMDEIETVRTIAASSPKSDPPEIPRRVRQIPIT
jgi:HK97 family phage prohead protease